MTGGHLGERAAALVDGELGHDARDRALAHLATCADCRTEVDAQRRLKTRLAGLVDCPPPAGLLSRLVELAEPGDPLPRRSSHVPGSSRAPLVSSPARSVAAPPGRNRFTRPSRPSGRRPPRRGRPRTRWAAATLAFVAVTMTTAFALGGDPSSSAPLVRPAVDRYAVEHASTVGGVPLADPAITVLSATLTGDLSSVDADVAAETSAPVLGPDPTAPVLVEAGYLGTAEP